MGTDREVLAQAAAWTREGARVALATVLSTWGSAPRPAGSYLAVREDGRFVGSVSGGCVENAVVDEARRVLASDVPTVVAYGVSDEEAWEVGLACGGRVEIRIEPIT
ncbi:MAG: XdhC family protein [Gemmatimonadota bacterium]